MAEKKEGDAEIIRSVLSINNVQVVGTLAWDKLQFFLHSICDRISSQALRLEKVEEQGKNLVNFKEEFNSLSQNALATTNSEKELEAQKQSKTCEAIETRLKALEELMAPFKDGKVLAEIDEIPKRVSVVEIGLQGAKSQVNEIDSQLKQIDTHVHQMDNDFQELDSEFTNKEAREGGLDTTDLTERIKSLEAQLEEFQELMKQITKAHTADLEAIQKIQRTLRSDLETKPMGQGIEGAGNNITLGELQKRLERKVDVDVVDQLHRVSNNTKDGLETLAKKLEELKKGIKKSTRFSMKMDVPNVVGGDGAHSNFGGSEDYNNRIQKLEDELKSLENSLLTKAGQATNDEIQFKIASEEGGCREGGHGGGDGALKDGGNLKDLMDKINSINNSVVALAERSDLAILLAKRAEQIIHPVAIIHGKNGHTDDEEIQFVINEHANRIMVYADMLQQIQVVLATKANNSTLSTLSDFVEKMKAEGSGASDVELEAHEKTQEQMNNTIKSHEKMLLKLLEDVGLLGKGVLIMSGHDDEFHPSSFPPSPALPISIEGAIPSTPLSPNSIVGEGNAKIASDGATSPTSVLTSPPSLPPSTLPRKISAISNSEPPSRLQSIAPIDHTVILPPTSTTNSGVLNTTISSIPKIDETTTFNSAAWKNNSSPSRKTSRFGSPNSTVRQGSTIHITNVQDASLVVAESKYHDTLVVLEDAINAKKLEPKENVAVLKGLVLEVEKISLELENYLILIDSLEQNKVDKIDFQSLAKIVKELKAMESAMLSGKPILGFKCMSCNHDLERLSPTRGPQIPTNQMPRSFLSMLSAERIFSLNKRDTSPIRTLLQTPTPNTQLNESTKALRKKNNVVQSKSV